MQAIRRFRADQGGTTAVVLSLTLLLLMGMVGAAVDDGRYGLAQIGLQRAVDRTDLALVPHAASIKSDQDFEEHGRVIFTTMFHADATRLKEDIMVSRRGRTVRVAAGGTVKTPIMDVLTDGGNAASRVDGRLNEDARRFDEQTRPACESAKSNAGADAFTLLIGSFDREDADFLTKCAPSDDRLHLTAGSENYPEFSKPSQERFQGPG